MLVIQEETMCVMAETIVERESGITPVCITGNGHRLLVNRFLLKDNERKEKSDVPYPVCHSEGNYVWGCAG